MPTIDELDEMSKLGFGCGFEEHWGGQASNRMRVINACLLVQQNKLLAALQRDTGVLVKAADVL